MKKAILQLPKNKGGFALPNFLHYLISSDLMFHAEKSNKEIKYKNMWVETWLVTISF